jgi:hypothetical protein
VSSDLIPIGRTSNRSSPYLVRVTDCHSQIHSLRCYALEVRVIVNFQHRQGWNIHTMAQDCRAVLGPYRDVASEATLLRLFRYLGASEDAIQEAKLDLRRWGRGGIHIDVPEDRLS